MAQKTVTYVTAITAGTFSSPDVTVSAQGAVTAISNGTGASRYTSTATAAGTTTLTNASTAVQYFTGATTQTVVLPVVTTLTNGWMFKIANNSSGLVTVQSSGANTLFILPSNGWATFTCVDTAGGTGLASWGIEAGVATTSLKTAMGNGSVAALGGIGIAGSASGTTSVAIGGSAAGTGAIAVGSSSSASANGGIALGASANSNVTNGVAIGNSASTSGIASSVSVGTSSTIADAAHALGVAINASSVVPGTLGVTVNSAAFQMRMYSSDYATRDTNTLPVTLTVTSARQQYLTGSTAGNLILPVASTLALGFEFKIVNNSTGLVTVQSSGANNIGNGLAAAVGGVSRGGWGMFTCILTSGTTAASWSYESGNTIL